VRCRGWSLSRIIVGVVSSHVFNFNGDRGFKQGWVVSKDTTHPTIPSVCDLQDLVRMVVLFDVIFVADRPFRVQNSLAIGRIIEVMLFGA
jgi:hypothetical protein